MKKYFVLTLVLVALLSACGKPGSNLADDDDSNAKGKKPVVDNPSNPANPNNPNNSAAITIRIVMSGNVGADNVTASPASGKTGDEITLNYALADIELHNRLVFSGTKTAIEQVNSAGTGAKKYIVNVEDSSNSVITINAVFTHSNLELDTIAFENDDNITKPYGISSFIRAIKNTGSGTGAISYASSDSGVATVNVNTGEVTIHNPGTTVITATKASDGIYAEAKAMYTLTVLQTVEIPRFTIINFEADAIGKTYEFTNGDSSPTVKVVADPLNSGQKSLQITSSNYNQAAIVPINLPYELHNYKSFSFRFNLLSNANLTSQSIMVYAAKNTADFKRYGFGNSADSSYAQFAANLIGITPAETIGENHKNKWNDYEITITDPSETIKNLKGDIYLAIGINCQNGADYLIDDLMFLMRDDFNPPPIVILPPPNPPATGALASKTYRNMFKEWGKTDAEVKAKVDNAFNKLFVNGTADEKIFVETGSDMAYIYTADTDDVRSEGMSYGMMMCVQMNDQARFNKLWKWARTYMYNTTNSGSNSRGYFSWQCGTNGDKKDKGPAPDGEEYFITALLFAHARWGSSSSGINNYAKEARQIIYDLTRRDTAKGDPYGEPSMFNTSNKMVRFATIGNSATFTDPSYHLPAFYEVWALELDNDVKNNNLYGIWSSKADLQADADFFRAAAGVSRAFFQNATNSTTGLGPDYANFDGTPTGGNHADFRFDAWRIAMNIGMDHAWWAADPWQKTFANRIQAFFVSKGVTSYGNEWTLSGNQLGADHSPGLVGCNAVASLAATHENAYKFIEDFWNISMTTGKYRYYDGCLYMMCMLHLSGNFKAYLSTNTTPVPPTPSSSISPTTATFDKKTGAQADISVTMTLNGNTFSSITNGSTTLTSGTHYTITGSTVTIKQAYLAAQSVGTTTLTFNFSAGSSQSLAITVRDTTSGSGGGGSVTGTSYNFANNTLPAGYPKYGGSGTISGEVTGGVLVVTKTGSYSTPKITLPFSIGSKKLSDYSGIKINVKGVPGGDFTNKQLFAGVGSTDIGSVNNAPIPSGSFGDVTIPITAGGTNTGDIDISFWLNNTNAYVIEIKSIELVPKP